MSTFSCEWRPLLWAVYHGHAFQTAPVSAVSTAAAPRLTGVSPACVLLRIGGWAAQWSCRAQWAGGPSHQEIAVWTRLNSASHGRGGFPVWTLCSPVGSVGRFPWSQHSGDTRHGQPTTPGWPEAGGGRPCTGCDFLPPEPVFLVQGHDKDIRMYHLTYHLL